MIHLHLCIALLLLLVAFHITSSFSTAFVCSSRSASFLSNTVNRAERSCLHQAKPQEDNSIGVEEEKPYFLRRALMAGACTCISFVMSPVSCFSQHHTPLLFQHYRSLGGCPNISRRLLRRPEHRLQMVGEAADPNESRIQFAHLCLEKSPARNVGRLSKIKWSSVGLLRSRQSREGLFRQCDKTVHV